MYTNQFLIGDYCVYYSELLGQGSYAKVYGAKKISTNQSICAKIIKITTENLKLLDREIQILNKLKDIDNHNLIKIYDIFNQNSFLCIFMERCKLNLAEHIADNKQKQQLLSLIEIIDISKQIVNGYHDLYSHHIIHRDLKPENLLIGKDNKIKICDFGFGKIVKYDNQLVAQSILGTPLYVSPQALMTGQYTSKTDVYSFGLILYFLIFQQSYYKAKTFDQLIQNIMVLDKEFSIGEFKNFGSQENITLLQYLLDGCIKFHEKDRFNWDQLFNIFDQISIPQKNRSQSKRIVELRSQSNNRNISQEEQLQMNPYEKLTQHIQIQNQKPPLKEHGMKVQLRALKQNQIIEKDQVQSGTQSQNDKNQTMIKEESPQKTYQRITQTPQLNKNQQSNYFSIKNRSKKQRRTSSNEKERPSTNQIFNIQQLKQNKQEIQSSKSKLKFQLRPFTDILENKVKKTNDEQICRIEQQKLNNQLQNQIVEQTIQPNITEQQDKKTILNNYFKQKLDSNSEQNYNSEQNDDKNVTKYKIQELNFDYNKIRVLKQIFKGILAKIQLADNLLQSQRKLNQILEYRQDIFRYLIVNYQQSVFLNLISIKNNEIKREQYPLQNQLIEFIEPINYFQDEEFELQMNNLKETLQKLDLKNQLAFQQLNDILQSKEKYNLEDIFELIRTKDIKYNFVRIIECYCNHYQEFLEQLKNDQNQLKSKELLMFLGYSTKFIESESVYSIENLKIINIDEICNQEENYKNIVKMIKENWKKKENV